jgi:hypothetical protein
VGITDLKESLRQAQTHFAAWARQKPETRTVSALLERLGADFFKLLDALTISRSRRHIERYYKESLKELGGFPTRTKPVSIYPELDTKNLFMSYDRLNNEISRYRLSLFNPSQFLKPEYRQEYDRKDATHPKPFVEGKHLERWLPAKQKWLEWGTGRAPTLFRRQTFPKLYTVPEKLISVDMAASVERLRVAYDNHQLFHNHSAWSFVPWYSLHGVRNNSLKKAARYRGEKPPRPDLPRREELEETSRHFAVKYLLGVMNSSVAREFLRSIRRSNIHLYPDDWKQLPIPDVSLARQSPIVALVDKILTARYADPNADITAFEADLNARVAALYGLAPDESHFTEESAASAPGSPPVKEVRIIEGKA